MCLVLGLSCIGWPLWDLCELTEETVSVFGLCHVNLKKVYKLYRREKKGTKNRRKKNEQKDIGGCLGLKKRTETREIKEQSEYFATNELQPLHTV